MYERRNYRRPLNEDYDDDTIYLSNGEITVEFYKSNGKWIEGDVTGETPYGWGGKRYMSYLSARDLIDYMRRDYGGRWYKVDDLFESTIKSQQFINESADRSSLKIGDIVGNTIDGFDFEVIELNPGLYGLVVRDIKTGEMRNMAHGSMYLKFRPY